MKNVRVLLFVVMVFAITACGGGGGGGTTTSPTTSPPSQVAAVSGGITGVVQGGVTLSLSPGGSSTVTAANGSYTFTGVANGSYTVTPSLAGYTFTPSSTVATVSGANVTGVNFVATVTVAPTYTVSGTVSGGTQGGVTLSLSPSGAAVVTAANGSYTFTGVANGSYTVTPSLAGYTFAPSSTVATVSGANVAGVNFTTPVPVLAVGKVLYPCSQAVCVKDLSTGVESVVWGYFNMYPDDFVPYRQQKSVMFMGWNINGLAGMSLTTLSVTGGVVGSGVLTPDNCMSQPNDWPTAYGYDLSPLGDFVVISSKCTPAGMPVKTDIFLVRTDGTLSYIRVTNDPDSDSRPVIGGVDATTGYVTVLFIKNGNIQKQVVDPALNVLVGGQNTLASGIATLGVVRTMAVNAIYTHVVFVKDVGGVSHIMTMPLAGGPEVDLGPGINPYWALDGSDRILYTASGTLWAIKSDGTGRMSVPTPSNLDTRMTSGLASVVFAPVGY